MLIQNAANPEYDGAFNVASATATQFTYALPFTPANSVSGSVDTGKAWVTLQGYDGDGRLTQIAAPSAVGGFSERLADLIDGTGTIDVSGLPTDFSFLRDNQGLITTNHYYNSTDPLNTPQATDTTAGAALNYFEFSTVQQGRSDTNPVMQKYTTYITHTKGSEPTIYLPAADTMYAGADSANPRTMTYMYGWDALNPSYQPTSATTALPVVSTEQHGSGMSDNRATAYYDAFGRTVWTVDAAGRVNYTAYDDATGAVTRTIVDVSAAIAATLAHHDLLAGVTVPSDGLNLATAYVNDALGRPIQVTDPKGRSTDITYNDALHVTRVYTDWHLTGTSGGTSYYNTTGPIQITREIRPMAGSGNPTLFMESYTATVADTASAAPTGGEVLTALQSLSVDVTNVSGQVVEHRNYFSLPALSDLTNLAAGSASNNSSTGNYHKTKYHYDDLGRRDSVVDPTLTITRTVFDGLGRETSVWVGTDDNSTHQSDGTGTGDFDPLHPGNMVKTVDYQFDGGGVGNGDLTKITQHPGLGQADRVTVNLYDYRDRLTASEQAAGASDATPLLTTSTYDNLGEVTQVQRYDGSAITLSSLDGNNIATSLSGDSGYLRAQSTAAYDDQGRVFARHVFSVDPSSGATSSATVDTNLWYGPRGEVIEAVASGQAATKYQYDGAGRNTGVFSVVPVASESYTNAASIDGNLVLAQMQTQYDGNGNSVFTIAKARFHDDADTALGALGTPTSGVLARVSYSGVFYDAINRPLAAVDWGTNGGTPVTLPGSAPSNSASVRVSTYAYDAAGHQSTMTDPAGIVTKRSFDALGRATNTIQGFTDGVPTAASNHTVQYTYNGDDQVLTQTDLLAGSIQRTTQYTYGVTTAGTNGVNANNLLASVQTTDPLNGNPPPSTLQGAYTYDALGETTTARDSFGNSRGYGYDSLGRMNSDTLTAIGTNVDGSIRRTSYLYDSAGNRAAVKGFANIADTTPLTTEARTFNGLGQALSDTQTQSGGASQSSSYTYSDPSLGSRLTGMGDSMNRVLTYHYTGAIDSAVGRLTSISQGGGTNSITIESNLYLGDRTLVQRMDQNGIALRYFDPTISSGDKYTGLDSFGQVAKENWVNNSGTNNAVIDSYQYGHDGDGRATVKQYADGSKDQVSYSQLLASGVTTGANSTLAGGGVSITPQYDADGRQTGSTASLGSGDSIGSSTTSFDSLGRALAYTETSTQSGGTLTYNQTLGYATNGKLASASQSQVSGASVAYAYHANDGTASANRISSMKVMQGTTVLSETDYTYDSSGRLATVTAQSGTSAAQTFTYGYTSNNLVSSVTRSAGPMTAYVYQTTGTGDQLSSITTSTTGTSAATVYGMAYTGFNAKGQALGAAVSGTGATADTLGYSYDAHGELLSASHTSGAATVTYSYDAAGNRTDLGTVNANNQYGNFTYDARGNLTDDGTRTYTYDPINELTAVTPKSPTTGSVKVTMGYDSQGRRAWKKSFAWDTTLNGGAGGWSATPTTYLKFAYDGMNLVAEFSGSGGTDTLLQTYAWNRNARGGVGGLLSITDYTSTPKTYLPFFDGNGNVTGLIDAATGSVAATYAYDAFGNLTASTGSVVNPFRFSTKYFDGETGLYNYGYRFYSPVQNRFITRDPSGAMNGGPNLYAFVGNDPVNSVDRLGLDADGTPVITQQMVFGNLMGSRTAPEDGSALLAALQNKTPESASDSFRLLPPDLNFKGPLPPLFEPPAVASINLEERARKEEHDAMQLEAKLWALRGSLAMLERNLPQYAAPNPIKTCEYEQDLAFLQGSFNQAYYKGATDKYQGYLETFLNGLTLGMTDAIHLTKSSNYGGFADYSRGIGTLAGVATLVLQLEAAGFRAISGAQARAAAISSAESWAASAPRVSPYLNSPLSLSAMSDGWYRLKAFRDGSGIATNMSGIPSPMVEVTRTTPRQLVYAARAEFNSTRIDAPSRINFLREFAQTPEAQPCFTDSALARMQEGRVPDGWQVHHMQPLFRGGDNFYDNLILVPKEWHAENFFDLHFYPEGKNPFGKN